ncbi:GH12 family glycosyl hydrolase domain-containing protein [Kineococcus rhizosphaerae]|uniref:Cellulose binding domain-containing protein n=1 Tax=Kineococcus rhizosphaerae TaxID=559628 RepID=A0A2T0R5C9_9ACTN|nr:cellulose binding domain-containing protein [Kineococcus rhizosphaerae]PRY15973.1 cellulose binding domain-containing protein [Kineococcus rhizosphaerae]
MPRLSALAPRIAAVTAVAGLVAGAATAVTTLDTPRAAAAAAICDQYGKATTADGRYVVQNNRWGTSAEQCVEPTATGFRLSRADGAVPTSGAPKSYPSIYWGCHYGTCTPGFSPVQASSSTFGDVRTSVSMTYPTSGEWDAAYDLWFDPTPRLDGQNTGAEVMVWLNHAGRPQPVGSKVATVTLAGATWDVWFGNTGWNVVSYVRTSATGSADFAVRTFFDDALSRGYVQRSWYLTSVQAGFEPWVDGAGLAVTSFSAGTGSTPTPAPTGTPTPSPTSPTISPTTSPTTSPVPTVTRSPRPTSGRPVCTATGRTESAWGAGAVQTVTVTNGAQARSGWTAVATLPAGQTVTNLWNGTWTQTGRTLTVRNASYNGTLAAGGSATFGYQLAATGSTATPTTITCT